MEKSGDNNINSNSKSNQFNIQGFTTTKWRTRRRI
jgi:hypothetical protein